MEVIYHPLVRRDVLDILRYYQEVSLRLADEFQAELQATIEQVAENPFRFESLHQPLFNYRRGIRLSQRHLAESLGPGDTNSEIKKWEKRRKRPTKVYSRRIVEFPRSNRVPLPLQVCRDQVPVENLH